MPVFLWKISHNLYTGSGIRLSGYCLIQKILLSITRRKLWRAISLYVHHRERI